MEAVLGYGAVASFLAVAAVVASRLGTAFALVTLAVCGLLLLVLGFELGFMSPEYREGDNRQG
jgi:hypothetical protein